MQVQARDDFVATAAYQPEPAAAAAARRFVRETLLSWPLSRRAARPDTLIDDAVLLTSELVTNAVVHAGTSVHVTCRLSAEAVEVVVLDGRPAQLIPDTPRLPADSAECTSGRGLQLPSELASAWGVTYALAAKAVWFRIGLPGSRTGTATDMRSVPAVTAAVADGEAGTGVGGGRTGPLARTPAAVASVPAWARRHLSRLGYVELLNSTAEAARAAVAADSAYLLDAGEDGELRVRAIAGAPPARLAAGSSPGSAARALAGTALSLVTVPLVVDGQVTGVLAVAAAESDRFGEQDAARLQDLADWSAPPLERARLGELEHGRQERAAFLAEASGELSVSLDEAKIAAAGARLAVGHLASWCAVLVGHDGAPLRLLHAAHRDAAMRPALERLLGHVDPPACPASDLPFRSRPAGWRWQPELPGATGGNGVPGPRAQPARLRRDKSGRSRPDAADGQPPGGVPPGGVPPGMAELAAGQAWCFPLDAADETLGLLVIGSPGEHWPPGEARELAGGLARRIAIALDNAGRQAPPRVSAVGRLPGRSERAQAPGRSEPAQAPGRSEPAQASGRPEPAQVPPGQPPAGR